MQIAEERRDPVVKKYFHLQEQDPEYVTDYFKSYALEYMSGWTDPVYTGPKSLAEYWHELWKTKDQFEKDLIDDVKGHHLIMLNHRDFYERKLNNYRQKT